MSKHKNLLKSTFIVSLMTMTSRVTGFLRDLVFAHVFGATAGFDAFLVAFRIPNFLRRLFAEGAFSQAFVPVLSEYRQQKTPAEVQVFVNQMAGMLASTLFVVTLVAVLITPWLLWLFAPGFVHDPSRYVLAVTMLRITFPYLLFISLTAFVSGILNTYGNFSIPAFTPNLLNLVLIGVALYLAPYFANPVIALAWGVFLGGIAQLLFQLPALYKLGLFPRPRFIWQDAGVKRVLSLMLPAVFGVSVVQISLFIDTLFASFLETGSLSWLYYSDRLTSFPLGVFGVAIATVVLPHLASKHAARVTEEFSKALDWGLRFVLLIAIPATIGMIMLAGPMLVTLFQYEHFTALDVAMTQRSLLAFAIGIPAFMLVKVLASGFYARQDIKTPVRIAVIAVLFNIALNAALFHPLKHAGLALATSLSATLNAGLLLWYLLRSKHYQPVAGWLGFARQLLFASSAMASVLWFATDELKLWFGWQWFARVWHLSGLCALAFCVYVLCLWISGAKWRQFIL